MKDVRTNRLGSDRATDCLVDVVIVNWNGGEEVVAAARSAVRFGGRPIVVDNGSVDGSAERVATQVREATVLRLNHNAGFARACNVGAADGSAPYILLLNPDAEIVNGTAAELRAAFAHPSLPIVVGPKTVDGDNRVETTVRRLPTLTVLTLYQLKLHRFARWIPPLRSYFMVDFDSTRPTQVDQVIGAALAIRRSDWERLGGLDEGYFLLFEEVDLCRRIADEGGVGLYWPAMVVRHIGSTSFRRLSHLQLQRIWNASLLRYAHLHLGRGSVALLSMTVPYTLVVSAARDALGRRRTNRLQPTSGS
jgi:hypothetical protein